VCYDNFVIVQLVAMTISRTTNVARLFVGKEQIMLRSPVVVPAIFAGVIVLVAASCGQGATSTQDQGERKTAALFAVSNDVRNGSIPVGFDRSAMMIAWNASGNAVVSTVATSVPVLHFSGYSLSGKSIAYTTLEQLLPNQKRVVVSLKESRDLKIDDLVPTGNLVVEDADGVHRVSNAGEFVVFAEWSPTDSDVLAYGYRSYGTSGIIVMNVKTMERSANVAQDDLNADLFLWQDGGQAITVFQEIPDESVVVVAGEHGKTVSHRARTFDVSMNALRDEVAPSTGKASVLLLSSGAGLEVASQAGKIRMANIMGGDDNELVAVDKGGNTTRLLFKAEQIRARNQNGIAFVNARENELGLYVMGGTAAASAVVQPVPLKTMTTVTYYIPDPAGSTVTFTQVGQSYSGGGCNVWDHTSTSSMAYAIDIQLSGSSYDSVLASGNGTTVSGVSSVTCNSLDNGSDGTTCSIYSSTCSSNGGWGNDVILSHADGYYTKYTHLDSAGFQVHTCGSSASAGCWLANEGGTGYTKGNKNGCGDHVHFQKQSGSGLNSTSASVSFVEDGTINSTACKTWSPAHGGMSCSL
jgi:hypothetical protein